MKKICLFLLSMILVLNSVSAFAESPYQEFIDIVKADDSVDMSLIDEDKIFLLKENLFLEDKWR